VRVKPNARLCERWVTHENLSQSCGAAIDSIGIARQKSRILSPLRGSEITVTVYPRLADSPWAGTLAAAPQLIAQNPHSRPSPNGRRENVPNHSVLIRSSRFIALIRPINSAFYCGKLHPLDRRDGSFAKFLMPLLATVNSTLRRASLSPSLFFRSLSPRAIPSLKTSRNLCWRS